MTSIQKIVSEHRLKYRSAADGKGTTGLMRSKHYIGKKGVDPAGGLSFKDTQHLLEDLHRFHLTKTGGYTFRYHARKILFNSFMLTMRNVLR